MNLKLVKLSEDYKTQLQDMMDEWIGAGNFTSPAQLKSVDHHDFEAYLAKINGKETRPGYVQSTTLFTLDTDRNIFVGAVDIRHELNESLLKCGGHLADGVRPSERLKGVATAQIGLALEVCKELGIDRVLMTCDEDNVGSYKSIVNNGGVLENVIVNEEGERECRFWIDNRR